MATSRDFITTDTLGEFTGFVEGHGWKPEAIAGEYEVYRARHPLWQKPLIVYRRANPNEDQLTTAGVAFYWGMMFKNIKLSNNHNW